MSFTYDNQFSANNVYGHAVSLLRQVCNANDPSAIHLDLGCGFGPIADSVNAMGLHYVGVDIDEDGLARLRSAGYEAHQLALGDVESTYVALSEIVGTRRLASVTILDTLEHLVAPLHTLQALRRLAGEHTAPIVVSVPNVTHIDIAARMLTGKFEYTIDGILDHTHIVNFSSDTLERMTRQAGLVQVLAADTKVVDGYRTMHNYTDALPTASAFYQLASHIRDTVDDTATSYQLVRAFLPGPVRDDFTWFSDLSKQQNRPLLSIVMRTTGNDTHTLCDTLACLAGQRDQDFEILLMGHNLSEDRQRAVEHVLFHQPDYLLKKLRFELVQNGGRTRPLNVAYRMATGRYIVTLDDDDLVFGNYVETFRKLHEKMPGRLLRARCGTQSARSSKVEGGRRKGAISTSKVDAKYPADFDFVAHLSDNFTPCMSVAYPREVIHVFGLKFDESLTTAEDWDFMMRSFFLLGIATSPELTSIYRLWSDKMTSARVHSQDEWLANRLTIMQKHNQLPIILPAGSLRDLRKEVVVDGTPAVPAPGNYQILQRPSQIKQRLRRVVGRALRPMIKWVSGRIRG